MANFATALKTEILRLARKEIRAEIEGLRKATSAHRSEIAELKRRVLVLEKQIARPSRRKASEAGTGEGEDGASLKRFSPKGFASHREKLGVSAAQAALLIGVSTPTIYSWEGGTKPRSSQLPAITAFRAMGKREAKSKLAELDSQGASED